MKKWVVIYEVTNGYQTVVKAKDSKAALKKFYEVMDESYKVSDVYELGEFSKVNVSEVGA